nr:hypothetical protein [Escherichia coli]
MKYGKGLVAPSHKRYSDLAVFLFLAHYRSVAGASD